MPAAVVAMLMILPLVIGAAALICAEVFFFAMALSEWFKQPVN